MAEAPVQIVQRQLDALNAHDLDAFCAPCAPDIVVEDSFGERWLTGIAEFREWYGSHLHEHPELRADLLDRIAVREWVIDEVIVTGYSDGSQGHFAIVMRIADDQIASTRILR